MKLFLQTILILSLSFVTPGLSSAGEVATLCNGEHNGMIDGDEQCETGACCTETCERKPALTVCRESQDATCDPEEICGEGVPAVEADCPADAFTPAETACNDGSACTSGEACDGDGSCGGGVALVCSDEEICTDDSCDPATGCVYTPNSAACDDGLFCTADDSCSNGTCSGSPKNCGDEDPCTDDACNEVEDACDHLANTAACDDGLFCNGADTCVEGSCSQHAGDPCEGANAGCAELCDEKGQLCTASVEDGTACDDGLVCTEGDSCKGGECESGTVVEECEEPTTTTTMAPVTTTTDAPVTTTTLFEDPCTTCGDITCDGKITARDAFLVLRAAVGLPSKCTLFICDYNGSGDITSTDALGVLRAAVDLPTVPMCPIDAEVSDVSGTPDNRQA